MLSGALEPSVAGVDFVAEPGQTIGIIGGTGSGKSTLVNLIPRFYDVTEGCVKVDGQDVRSYSLKELRERIGIVMQKAVLFKGTIKENLLWGNEDATEEEVKEALELSQSIEFVEKKEDGVDSFVEQGAEIFQRTEAAPRLLRGP